MLTAVDGQSITYDAMGNPTSYYNGTRWTFTWAQGRRLTSASDGATNISYTYDADGLRTSKTVNGVEHSYYYAGGRLLRETFGNNTLDFFYDASGNAYALKYNGTLYYYITNLLGDVMSIVDAQGAVVASYNYDPYGNILTATGDLADVNPIRYRGYVYDTESSLYYLQSRYYDPELGRFINADVLVSTGQGMLGNNMFSYCNNNAVNLADASGSRSQVCIDDPFNAMRMPWQDDPTGGKSAYYLIQSSENPWITGIVVKYVTNTDEQAVLNAKRVAFYKGQLVVRHNFGFTNGRSGSFIIMFLHEDEINPEIVKHEWGHFAQMLLMGIPKYATTVAIPSALSDPYDPYYCSNPWERTADFLGGARWPTDYREGSLAWGLAHFILGPISVPLFYIWGVS